MVVAYPKAITQKLPSPDLFFQAAVESRNIRGGSRPVPGKQVALWRTVFGQPYEVRPGGTINPVTVPATGVVQNLHDPNAQGSAKGQGEPKKDCVGDKVQVVVDSDGNRREERFEPVNQYMNMVDAFSEAVLNQRPVSLPPEDGLVQPQSPEGNHAFIGQT
ncbi:MAG TPA: hypothetical protein VGD78_13360 [Chthoniobacterales bacterium]